MAERFERIFSLTENLYTEGSPLILSAGALLMDKEQAKFLVQLKFKNIGQKKPISVMVKIIEMDSRQNPLGTQTEFTYTNLSVSRGEEFGTQTPIFIENSNTRAFGVCIQKVIFSDASVFSAEDRILTESIPALVSLKSWLKDNNAVLEYRARYGTKAKYKPEKIHSFWRCTCGSYNYKTNTKCFTCGNSFEATSTITSDELKKDHIYNKAVEIVTADFGDDDRLQYAIELFSSIPEWKDSDEQIIKCQKQIENIKKNRKKGTKIAVITLALIAVSVLLVMLVFNVFIPIKKYSDALALMEAGKYTEAIDAFNALDGYKDSAAQIQNCKDAITDGKYNDALALMEAGKYDEAITSFAALNNYKDSAAQIQNCKNAITDAKYNNALALMEAGKYNEAIVAFTALNNYKDSKTQIQNCKDAITDAKYNNALALMEAGKYDEAIAAFTALNNYKDSAAQIQNCKNAIKEEKYTEALALMGAGKYDEAIVAFTALNNYKDSAAQIQNCKDAITDAKYNNALALMEAEKYEDALWIFNSIKKYKDSEEHLSKCVTETIKISIDSRSLSEISRLLNELGNNSPYIIVPKEYRNKYFQLIVDIYGNKLLEKEPIRYLKLIADDHESASALVYCYDVFQNGTINAENISKIKKMFEIDIVKKCLTSDSYIIDFMFGEWYSLDKTYYLKFYYKSPSSSVATCSHNLPHVSMSGVYFNIYDLIFVYESENHQNQVKIYKFDFLDAERVKVYCYKDKKTYTLYREK